MPKRIIAIVLVGIAAAWLVLTFGAKSRKSTVSAREWPMGLGRLDSVPARYPKQSRTPAAHELERLAATIPKGPPDPVADYARKQLQRTDRTIDPAPPISVDLDAIRSILLSKQPIGWDVDIARAASAPLPNLVAHMKLSRLLTTSALERARLGDTNAWEDLRSQTTLSRGLWQRPEMISAMIAMAIDRNVIAAARKMPQPAPPWFDELRAFDYRKAMLAATQAEAWIISSSIKDFSAGDPTGRHWVRHIVDRTVKAPYLELSRSDLVARQRETAIAISSLTTCGLDAPPERVPWWNQPAKVLSPNITGAWRRVFRLRAELELTEHALGLRSGTQSQCSDGHWILTPASVKFSKPIPLDSPGVIPLEIRR